jgi:hypothetical protein
VKEGKGQKVPSISWKIIIPKNKAGHKGEVRGEENAFHSTVL